MFSDSHIHSSQNSGKTYEHKILENINSATSPICSFSISDEHTNQEKVSDSLIRSQTTNHGKEQIKNKKKKKKKMKQTCVSEDSSSLLSDEFYSDAVAHEKMVAKIFSQSTHRMKKKKMKASVSDFEKQNKVFDCYIPEKMEKKECSLFVNHQVVCSKLRIRALSLHKKIKKMNHVKKRLAHFDDVEFYFFSTLGLNLNRFKDELDFFSKRRTLFFKKNRNKKKKKMIRSTIERQPYFTFPAGEFTGDYNQSGHCHISAISSRVLSVDAEYECNSLIPKKSTTLVKDGSGSLFSPNIIAEKKRKAKRGPKLAQAPFCLYKEDFPPLQAQSTKSVLNPAAVPYQKTGFSQKYDYKFYSNTTTPPDLTVSYPECFTYPWPDTADDDSDSHDSCYYRDDEDDFIAF